MSLLVHGAMVNNSLQPTIARVCLDVCTVLLITDLTATSLAASDGYKIQFTFVHSQCGWVEQDICRFEPTFAVAELPVQIITRLNVR